MDVAVVCAAPAHPRIALHLNILPNDGCKALTGCTLLGYPVVRAAKPSTNEDGEAPN
jgi:hypothetical protein